MGFFNSDILNAGITFSSDFNKLYKGYCKNKIGLSLLDIEGISPSKIDIGKVSKNFFTKRISDISIDTNANINDDTSINNYASETVKGIFKLNGYYLLWKSLHGEHTEKEATRLIKSIWDGKLYFHDASGDGIQKPYCVAFSTSHLMNEGRQYGQLHSTPAKRSYSFVSQVIESVMDMSQEFAGATAISDFLVNLTYFLKKDGINLTNTRDRKYVADLFQHFVHVLNNKFRIGGQSPFTNLPIFCEYHLQNLFKDIIFPDGSHVDIVYTMEVQKICAEWFSKGDPSTGLPYRFPIVTFNLMIENGVIKDTNMLNFLSRINVDKGVFNIYPAEGNKIASCLTGGTELIYKDSNDVISKGNICNIVKNFERNEGISYKVLYNGSFIPIKSVLKVKPTEGKILNIKLTNGTSINITKNHPSMIVDNGKLREIESRKLNVGDRIPIAKNGYKGLNLGTFDLGWLVGMFIAEGNVEGHDIKGCGKTIKFSLHLDEKEYTDKIEKILSECFGERIHVNLDEKRTARAVRCTSRSVVEFMKRFITQQDCLTRRLTSKLFSMSEEFRKGVLLGMIDGDDHVEPGRNITIHTNNRDLMLDFVNLCRSLGLNSTYCNNRNYYDGKLIFSHYCTLTKDIPDWIRQNYSLEKGYSNTYKDEGDFYSVKIKEITEKDYDEFVYDLEVDSEDHMFQLANGVITHNCCRLINSFDQRQYKTDTFGNGGTNIGSTRVVTLILPRMARDSDGDIFNFSEILHERIRDAVHLLVAHRKHILQKRVDGGFLKFFKPLNWLNMNMFFSTIGIIGMREALDIMGLKGTDAIAFAKKVLIYIESESQRYSKEYGISFNVEEIPGESTAVTAAKKDNLFYPDCEHRYDIYSNQFLSLSEDYSIMERLRISGMLMNHLSGGGIVHINVAERIKNPEIMKNLIIKAVEYGVPHFAVNYGFGICENKHTTVCGNNHKCSECGGIIQEHLTRIVGYFTKTTSWNKVRREKEFKRRVFKVVK